MRGRSSTLGLTALVALAGSTAWAADPVPAATRASATEQPATTAPAPAAAVPAAPAPTAEKPLPFRLGLFFAQAFGQSGALTRYPGPFGAPGNVEYPAPLAFGADIAIGIGSAVRYHLGLAHQRESRAGYSAKGFRLDLVSLGFPISVFSNEKVALHVEPIARVIRGEILFPSGQDAGALFRVESGFAVAITAAIQHWFVAVEPLALDIRSFSAFTRGDGGTISGYSRLWWFQITAGREF